MARIKALIQLVDKAIEIASKSFIYNDTWGMIAPLFTMR